MAESTVSASGDLRAELLFGEAREREAQALSARERTGEILAGSMFLLAAAATALAAPWPHTVSWLTVALYAAGFAAATRVRFDVGAGYTNATQLVLVPMLFAVPLALVPLTVLAGNLGADGLAYVTSRRHRERALFAFGDSIYAVAPVLVLWALAAGPAEFNLWPAYLLALSAQFALDFAGTAAREKFELGIPARQQFRDQAWVFAVDGMLSPIGLLFALQLEARSGAAVLLFPVIGLLTLFGHERRRRFQSALELGHAYRGTAMLLADVVESDDEYTGLHSRSVVSLALEVAGRMGASLEARRRVEFGALLHDAGKIRVPNEIINKAGPLDEAEREIIRQHTIEGQRLLERGGGPLSDVGVVVRASHEHWDGLGYPDGLAGTEIPLEARIVACCDAYSAMTTNRSYRAAMAVPDALDELRRQAGRQFDPDVAHALIAVIQDLSHPLNPETPSVGVV